MDGICSNVAAICKGLEPPPPLQPIRKTDLISEIQASAFNALASLSLPPCFSALTILDVP